MNEPASLQRFIEVLDAYGSDHNQWPVEEQEQLALLLARSDHARQLLEETAKLDAMLDQFTVPEMGQEIRNRVINAIPFGKSGWVERFLDWLFPAGPGAGPELLWRPALAVTLPLLVGFALGMATQEQADSLDLWEEDIYLVGVQQTGDSE
jgi:hypothetical protein